MTKPLDPAMKRINDLVQAHCDVHGEKDMPTFVVLGAEEAGELAAQMKAQNHIAVAGTKNGIGTLHFEGGGQIQMVVLPVPTFLALAWNGPVTGKTFAAAAKAHKKKKAH